MAPDKVAQRQHITDFLTITDGLVLTRAGETLARNIMQRHQLLTDFLRMLGIREEEIYHDVEGMEHHISPQTLQAIESLLFELRQNPKLVERVRSRALGS